MNRLVVASLIVAGVGFGCAMGTVASNFVVPAAKAGTTPITWEYSCVGSPRDIGVEGSGFAPQKVRDSFTKAMNEMGAQGWRLYDKNTYQCALLFIRSSDGAGSSDLQPLVTPPPAATTE